MISKKLKEILNSIKNISEECGREPQSIRIVAITKNHSIETIREAYDAGLRDFGENKVQELLSKMPYLPSDISWHMVGTIQTNKIKYLTDRVNWIHSASKVKVLKELEKRAQKSERTINTLLQVNISNEEQKSGCHPDDLPDILRFAATLNYVKIRGFMGMASFTDDEDLIRKQFQNLRILRDKHRNFESSSIQLKELSMGMSNDYRIAIEEGATILRLGSVLFGDRYVTASQETP